jgi:hypothetical protein
MVSSALGHCAIRRHLQRSSCSWQLQKSCEQHFLQFWRRCCAQALSLLPLWSCWAASSCSSNFEWHSSSCLGQTASEAKLQIQLASRSHAGDQQLLAILAHGNMLSTYCSNLPPHELCKLQFKCASLANLHFMPVCLSLSRCAG